MRRLTVTLRAGYSLVAFHVVSALLVLFGPTYDGPNRTAGVASISISLVLCAGVMMLGRRRMYIAGGLVALGAFLSAAAFAAVPASELRWRAPWAREIALSWPHLPADLIVRIADVLGLTGDVTRNTVGFMSVALPVAALALGTASPRPRVKRAWLAVALLTSAVVLGTNSRGSLVGLIVGVLLVASITFIEGVRLRTFILATSAAATGAISLQLFITDKAWLTRAQTWSAAIRDIGDDPLVGAWGSFSNVHPGLYNAHNIVLQTILDLGAVGFAALIIAVWMSMRSAAAVVWKPRQGEPEWRIAMGRLTLSSIVALCVAGLVDSVLTMPTHGKAEWITVLVPIFPLLLAASAALRSPPSARD